MRSLLCIFAFLFTSCTQPQPTSPPEPPVPADLSEAKSDHKKVGEPVDPEPTYLSGPIRSTECAEEPSVLATTNHIFPAHDPESEEILSPGRGEQKVTFQDGAVRARFPVRRTLKAKMAARVGKGRAVGVRFEGTSAQLFKQEGNRTRNLGGSFPIYRLEQRKELEVVLTLLGNHVFAQIHDARSGLELLTLYGIDPDAQQGALSVDGPGSWAASRKACTEITLNLAEPVARYISVPKGARDSLKQPLFKLKEEDQEGLVYETNMYGIERAHCENIPLSDVLVEAPWKYIDEDFWTYRSQPPVKAGSGFRTDLSYFSPAMVEQILKGYAREFPELVRLEEIGRSAADRPILAIAVADKIQANDPRPSLLLNAAHHGDEPLTTSIIMEILQELLTGDDELNRRVRKELVVYFVPFVNPDGALEFLERSRFDGRKVPRDLNADKMVEKREGVDLNRNYPILWNTLEHVELSAPYGKWYRGPSAASEPETRAMMALAERERFISSISYHTGTTAVLAPYTIDMKDPAPNELLPMAKEMSEAMGTGPDGRNFPYRKNLYAVEGTDQDWLRHTHGTAAFLVESARTSPLGYCARKAAIEPSIRAWKYLANRTLNGSFVYGYSRGFRVGFKDQTLSGKEVWNARPRDGFWGRYVDESLIRNGRVVVELETGRDIQVRTVQLDSGMTRMAEEDGHVVQQRSLENLDSTVPAGMARIIGGDFIRGKDNDPHRCEQPDQPTDKVSAAMPATKVSVSTFYMDLTEVTNEAYQRCKDAGKCTSGPAYADFNAPQQPVTGVTWFDARNYCELMGKRLPTEAEWEYAARGPNSETYPWGESAIDCKRAVIKDERGRSCGELKRRGKKPEAGRVLEVGSRPAGRYGLFDMVGNAEEWVADWWTPSWEDCGKDCLGRDPKGPCGGADDCPGRRYKSVRGGSWYWPGEHATGYHRRRNPPTNKPFHHFGFRCAADHR